MKFTKIAAGLLLSTVLLCGCTKDSNVALRVNDKLVTKQEFNNDLKILKSAQFGPNTPKELLKDNSYPMLILKQRLVQDTIIRTLLNEEFDKRKITATNEEIEAKKDFLIKQIGSKEKLDALLKEKHVSKEKLESDMVAEVKMDKLVKSLNIKDATDKEAEKYYKENKSSFDAPERVRTAHILIDTNAENIKRSIVDDDKDAKLSNSDIENKVKEQIRKQEALVQEVYKKAKANPKDFAKLAKEYSIDTVSAQNGGELGFAARGRFVPEYENAAFKGKVGTILPPVKSVFGTHIIYVEDKAAKGIQPFNEVKNDLKIMLSQQKKSEAVQKLVEGLKSGAKIEYVDNTLSPETLNKEIEETLKKQVEQQAKLNTSKKENK